MTTAAARDAENNARIEAVSRAEIERRHRGHWFSEGALRFFRSRPAEYGYRAPSAPADAARIYFVSSEQFEASDGTRAARRYTVRYLDPTTGSVDTLGEFQQYPTSRAAHYAARAAAAADEKEATR